jgi:hypothetical protein
MTTAFQLLLSRRIQSAFLLALIGSGCGGVTIVDDDGEGGSGGSNTGGANTGGTNAGGSTNGGSNVGGFADGGAGGSTTAEYTCLVVEPAPTSVEDCPSGDEAFALLPTNICGMPPQSVNNPEFDAGRCCYTYVPESEDSCGVGRPFILEGRVSVAKLGSTDKTTTSWHADGFTVNLTDLSATDRKRLGAAWLKDALLEHASVASFGRFALELLAVGAPADLIEDAHQAALDEVRHAKLCFALASTYLGRDVAPARFSMGGAVEVREDLAAIAAAVVREGCIGETLAAAQAQFQLERSSDPAVRKVLATIVEDESRHAELAWRSVAWLMREGGEPVRAAVREAFARPLGGLHGDNDPWSCEAHGRPDADAITSALASAHRLIVLPCARELLASV